MKQKRVLIIGSGNRVKSTLLPALTSLDRKYTIIGIASRSSKIITIPGRSLRFRTVTDLDFFDFRCVDIIVLSITLENVPSVLKELSQKPVSNITLFLDTPVMPVKDIFSIRLFRRFKKVLVLEDYVSMSNYIKTENILKKGTLGKLKKIYLFHSGFRYHAIAILKKITNQNFISFARVNCIGGGIRELTINFQNGVTCSVLEPRDYNVGRFLIVGEKGWLSDYSLGGASGINSPNANKYNSLKIEAIIKMFDSYLFNHKYRYCYMDGVYDNILMSALDRFGIFFDFRLPLFPRSVILELIRFISIV